MHDSPFHGRCHIAVVGAGGNIGSHVVPHLARMPEIGRLTLIDCDRYEEHNVRNQAIGIASIGKSKARVQAQVARRISPHLEIDAIAERVEAIPLGLLQAEMILTCVDSRRSRQYVNQAARRLGVPWVDAGVLADGLLARIDTYLPAADLACLECGWDAQDYAALEQSYPCTELATTASSSAPSGLGALAAALQALECARHFTANGSGAPAEQIVIGVADGCHYRTTRLRNPACRLVPHDAWDIHPLEMDLRTATLRALFLAVADRVGPPEAVSVRIDGKLFVTDASCGSCRATRQTLRVSTPTHNELGACAACRGALVAGGFGVTECLERAALRAADLRRSLRRIGIRPHEVITATSGGQELHLELRDSGPAAATTRMRYAAAGVVS
jgi:molybdopterin/thiamine biosynthesis adenylyltransferase